MHGRQILHLRRRQFHKSVAVFVDIYRRILQLAYIKDFFPFLRLRDRCRLANSGPLQIRRSLGRHLSENQTIVQALHRQERRRLLGVGHKMIRVAIVGIIARKTAAFPAIRPAYFIHYAFLHRLLQSICNTWQQAVCMLRKTP